MKKIHVIAVALLLGVAAVFGVIAAGRTANVGIASRSHATDAAVTARANRLHQVELALRKALRDRPPALPPLPSATTHSSASRVVYQRPAPIVVLKHSAHGDHEHESEGGESD
jgi:hypothetical protein